jgi:hypothetical protein
LNLQLRSAMKRMLSVERHHPRSLIHPERGIDEEDRSAGVFVEAQERRRREVLAGSIGVRRGAGEAMGQLKLG